MKCPNCGAQLEEGSKFCYDCGTDVTTTNSTTETPVMEVEEPIEVTTSIEPSVVETTPIVEETVAESIPEPAQDEVISESVIAEPVKEQEVIAKEIIESTPAVVEETKHTTNGIDKKNKTLLTIGLIAVVLALLVAAFYIFKDYFM